MILVYKKDQLDGCLKAGLGIRSARALGDEVGAVNAIIDYLEIEEIKCTAVETHDSPLGCDFKKVS